MNEQNYAYILITPAKNEEKYLPKLIHSIVSQNVKPSAWFIIDDGSSDSTNDIVKNASSMYDWIHGIRLDSKSSYDIEEHYSQVCRDGFSKAIQYCENNHIPFEFVALSDADMKYPEEYFYDLIKILADNPKYGIVSGKVQIMDDVDKIHSEYKVLPGSDHPMGTGRVWKFECFKDTDGYMITKSPDTVSNAYAMLKGWEIKQFDNFYCYQLRATGNKMSFWNGYYSKGRRAYYVGTNPLTIMNVIIDMIFISRQYKSMMKSAAYFIGYMNSLIKREPQLENVQIRKYIGSYKRVFKNYYIFIKNLF